MPVLVAAAEGMSSQDVLRILWLSIIVIGLIIVAFVVVAQVRRRLNAPDEPSLSGAGGGFTLSDLRQLHKSGQMSNEEFERAKSKIVEAAKRVSERDRAGAVVAVDPITQRRQAQHEREVETKPTPPAVDPDADA